ncbi:MAG TPA: hypothetical protein VGY94_12715, partial [Acidobacteriaceae bacterium]|nr:hypothetical protein [Acidobacteriaceae bacterium]
MATIHAARAQQNPDARHPSSVAYSCQPQRMIHFQAFPVAWRCMHDLQFVRANLALVEEKLRARGQDPGVVLGSFETFDLRRRQNISESEAAKAQRNKLSQEVARLKKSGQDATAIMEQVRILKEQSEGADKAVEIAEREMHELLTSIPNLTQDSVPPGTSEHDNVEQKQWGTKPHFDFTPRPHWELGEALGILDLERA